MRTDPKEIRFQLLLAVLLTVGSFFFFQLAYPSHLFLKEQFQLYLFTAAHFLSYFDKPAWLAANIGDFLTQFLYLRGGGPLVLALLFLLEWRLLTVVLKRMRTGVFASLFALFPVAIEWILHTDLLYTPTHTVAFLLVLIAFWGYTCITNKWTSIIAGVLLAGLLYNLAGSASFVFPWMVLVYEASNRKNRGWYWVALFAIILTMPLLLRGYYLLTLSQAYLYPFASLGKYSVILLFALILLIPMLVPVRSLTLSEGSFSLVVVALVITLSVGILWKADFNKEKIYTLAVESYFGNWEKVNRLVETQPLENNRLVTYYTNIALSQQNQLPDHLLDYYQPASQGLFISVGPSSGWLPIFFSNDVFYHLGDMNMAQHSAMLGMIFSPNHRSSRMVKRLAEINLANEDTTAARKYLRILDATLFHSRWAKGQERALSGTDSLPAAWLPAKQAQLPTYDLLRSAADYPASLTMLVKSQPDNKAALDYLLCYYLLNKDIPSFISAYNTWCKDKTEFIPRLYSEALLIHLIATKATEKVVQSYKIPTDKINDFMEYTRLYEENNGAMEPLQAAYGTSYWFYYHFAQVRDNDE